MRTYLRSSPPTRHRRADDAPTTSSLPPRLVRMACEYRRRHLAGTPSTPTARPRSGRIHLRSAPTTCRYSAEHTAAKLSSDPSCRHTADANRETAFSADRSWAQSATTRRPLRVCHRSRCEWLAEAAADILPARHRRQPRERVQGGAIFGARRRRADDPPPMRRRHRFRAKSVLLECHAESVAS